MVDALNTNLLYEMYTETRWAMRAKLIHCNGQQITDNQILNDEKLSAQSPTN